MYIFFEVCMQKALVDVCSYLGNLEFMKKFGAIPSSRVYSMHCVQNDNLYYIFRLNFDTEMKIVVYRGFVL